MVFAAAGGDRGRRLSGGEVDGGKLAIGVDSNQNHLHPGTMLSSMVKRVDVAIEEAFTDGHERQMAAGPQGPGPGRGRRRLGAGRATTGALISSAEMETALGAAHKSTSSPATSRSRTTCAGNSLATTERQAVSHDGVDR